MNRENWRGHMSTCGQKMLVREREGREKIEGGGGEEGRVRGGKGHFLKVVRLLISEERLQIY